MSLSFPNEPAMVSTPGSLSVPWEFRDDFGEWAQANRYYLETGDPASVLTEVRLLDRIRAHPRFTSTSAGFRALVLNESGAALNRCYIMGGDAANLEAALSCWGEAVQIAPPGQLALFCLTNLAAGLRAHYFRTGDPKELGLAIELLEKAIALTPEESPDLTTRLNNLGNALHTRWECDGREEDLQASIAALQNAVQLTHIRSPDLPLRLNNLGRAFLQRYNTSGDLDALHEGIESSEQAVRLMPEQSPDRPLCLAGLGLGLLYRYGRENSAEDLRKAIALQREAIRISPDSAPEKSMYLNDLAVAQHARYQRDGDAEDLGLAIEAYEKAASLTPARSTELPRYLNNLSTALGDLYLRTGELDVLERVIGVCKEAVEQTPSNSPDLPTRLANLANGLAERFMRTAEPRDLEQAIQIYEEALRKSIVGAKWRGLILNSLALSLRERARLSGDGKNFDRCVEILEATLAETPSEAPERAMYLTNLGSALAERHGTSRDPADLRRAIALSEEAISLTASDSPMGSIFRFNLSENLYCDYLLSKDARQLERAVHLSEEALAGTPPDSPSSPRYLGALGRLLAKRYTLNQNQDDLRRAIDVYEKALALTSRSFQLSPAAYQLGQPQRDLMDVHTAAARTFLTAANVWPDEAANWTMKAMAAVEATKSRLFTNLVTRKKTPAPFSIPVDLIEREWALVEELAGIDGQALARHGLPAPQSAQALPVLSLGPAAQHSNTTSHQVVVDQQERLNRWTAGHKALLNVRADIEKYEGGDGYVALRTGDALSALEINELAAELGPETALLSLAMTPEHTLLFAVSARWPEPYAGEVEMGANDWFNLMSRFFEEVHSFDDNDGREETWFRLLEPLLAPITGHMQGVKHVVLFPHWAAHLLPWGMLASQAGWDVSMSTAPALGLLARVLRHAEPRRDRLKALVLGNPTGDLSHAESEAVQVAALLQTGPLIGSLICKEKVFRELEREDIQLAHFATHAYFAPDSPLDSGIVVADGVLTAREILERGLRMPPFVVLSACQTGMTRALGGDELAGLSQAFFATGVRSQLLSLWEVDDPATEHLITSFYQHWIQEELDKATALRKAAEETRLASTEWARTYYWGAFTLVGDWR